MQVIKRNGKREAVTFDKVSRRLRKLCKDPKLPKLELDILPLAQKVIQGLYDGITTTELDNLAAETAAGLGTHDLDWLKLAARISISNHQKQTDDDFHYTSHRLHDTGVVREEYWDNVCRVSSHIKMDYNRDYNHDYFGFKTLERAYLLKVDGKPIERPQDMWMRVAIELHGDDVEKVQETYDLMSQGNFTHATPTLFNSGTLIPQLSSCFLLDTEEDSVKGIYNTVARCADISMYAGGIGWSIDKVRAKGSLIRKTGISDGITPMLKVYNETARYINQNGKRKGSFAAYLSTWHGDIFEFLDLKKNHGKEEMRARDLFYGLWISDLFMKRVESEGQWSLFCPNDCPMLLETYGDEFEGWYEKYEKQGLARKTIKAQDLWFKILEAQIETGTPYMLYKDACNKKSNQKNLGIIKSSNLCVSGETLLLTDKGYQTILELEGSFVNAWNGEEFSEVQVKRTGENQTLLIVTFSNGSILRCTPYHKFYMEDGSVTEASRLRTGDKLEVFKTPDGVENHVEVIQVHFGEDNDDTFCATEPKRNRLTFNGIVTGNCCEILEYTSKEEVAVCNLASIALPKFVVVDRKAGDYIFDHQVLFEVTQVVTRNLDKVIDKTFYPVKEAEFSNKQHRPMGIGVQGLADVFAMLRLPFESAEARELNREIFETIYFAALTASCEMARDKGVYPSYLKNGGCPVSKGILQQDMWNKSDWDFKSQWDWSSLRIDIGKHGLRNSLLLAPMPTASTSQILGNFECFEPPSSNMYVRRTLAGEFIVANKHLLRDLKELGLWNDELRQQLMRDNGSVQNLEIPDELKKLYKTAYEVSQKAIINMAADRGAYVCQSQSMNLFVETPTYAKLSSMHFYAWKSGLKTGMYYLRSKAAVDPIKFTLDVAAKSNDEPLACSIDNPDCEACGA